MKRTLLSLLVMAATAHVGAQGVTDAMIANDATTPDDVLSWGLGTQGQRHSALNNINANTVEESGSGLVDVFRRRKTARPGVAAAGARRQDVRYRFV